MLTVLVVSQYLSSHAGGAERYIQEVCFRLENKGMKIHFLSAEGGQDLNISRPFRLFSAGFHPLWPRQVDDILRKVKPDMIFAHFTVPGITDVVLRKAVKHRIPVCLAYHSDVTGPEWYRRSMGYLYYKLAGCKTLEGADRIFVCSRKYRQTSPWLASLKKPFDFIGYGVDPVMSEAKQKQATPYIFFAGKPDVTSKGFNVLYKAWIGLKDDYPGLGLLVAGNTTRADEYPGARFLGQVNSRRELADLYASASVTVLPSISNAESFGMVLAESLLAGTPVVGSDIGGIPAIVDEGFNGYLAKPGDSIFLGEAVKNTLISEQKLRQNIREFKNEYLERYNWDRIAERVGKVLVKCRRV
ncbi:glycosyltransferase family 4 protein [Desulfonatronovibrio magnus]|uniref:glycosyltransferase family 4 protein n=1 Tax=Desulfonatronovibrio magnus TaxID=698827 RepID=UPI0005EB9103|nr:glycosyltransferase family 4 protein [Desulfonatronovibrio magnus]